MSDPNAPQVPPQQPPVQPPVQPPAQAPTQPPAPPAPAPTQPIPTQAPQPPVQAYAVPPTGPPMTGPPGGPPPGGNFKSGKGKTIALIVGGVVAIGVLGGVGALVLGGGDDGKDASTASPEVGNSGILSPSPVASASPEPPTAPPTEPPTEPPTAPPTEPSPTTPPTDPEPPASGDTVTIGNGVQIFLPDTWQVSGDPGDTDVNLTDGNGSYAYAGTGTDDPSTGAASVITANLENLLPGDLYSQLQTSEIAPLEPFGSVVSVAVIEYQAVWVDPQGSAPIYGKIYAAVRQDGTVLVINVEHIPPEEFEASFSSWGPVVQNSMDLFGAS